MEYEEIQYDAWCTHIFNISIQTKQQPNHYCAEDNDFYALGNTEAMELW